MEYVNTLDSLLLMDASKARVWDMTYKLQYAESAAHIYIMPAFYGEHCMEQEHARNIVWNGMVYDQS